MLTCWSRFVPLLTNLCGVFGGTITTWPGSTVMVSSPTVNVHVPAWHMNGSSYGCRCRSGPSPGAWRLMKKDMLAPWSLPSNFLARSLPGMSSNGIGLGGMWRRLAPRQALQACGSVGSGLHHPEAQAFAPGVTIAPLMASVGENRVSRVSQLVCDISGERLKSARVLDLGCNDGGFSLEL